MPTWKRFALAAGVTALCVSAGVYLTAMTSPSETGPHLTHTITRGDLLVTVTEQGLLESAENTEIKCKVRGQNTVIWVIENGSVVKPGDVLIRLDTLFIEEQIDERTKYAHWSRSSAERSAADLKRAKLALSEYEDGRYVTRLLELQKDLFIAEGRLRSAEDMLSHAERMAQNEYISDLEVEEKEFAVQQAQLDLDLKKTEIDVLKRFSRAEELQSLQGDLAAIAANHEANVERADADASRRDRALEELKHCVVRAERGGLVIHPNAAKWELAPIAEGATVHKDQVLLLMPDLSRMQVKVGIDEAVVDRVEEGLSARVTLPETIVHGTVSSVASVTRPAGWWTGNEVKYDTLVALPDMDGLRPGMSAEVEVIVARYEDVLTVPVAAIVESAGRSYCWVNSVQGSERRELELGDNNGVFAVVLHGVEEGEEVVLNPLSIREAQLLAQQTDDDTSDEASRTGSDD